MSSRSARINVLAIFLFLITANAASSSNTPPPEPDAFASKPTINLWQGFDITLPNLNDLDNFVLGVQDVAVGVFGSSAERYQQLKSSPVGVGTKKFANTVAQFSKDRISELQKVGIPEDVARWLEGGRKDTHQSQTTDIPREIYNWILEHPDELKQAGHMLVNGALVAAALFPAAVWTPVLEVLGWGPLGPIASTAAPMIQSAMGSIPVIPSVFSYLQSAAMGGYGVGAMDTVTRIGAGLVKIGIWVISRDGNAQTSENEKEL